MMLGSGGRRCSSSCPKLATRALDPRSQTLFGNAIVFQTLFRPRGNRVAGPSALPNRFWERGSTPQRGVPLFPQLFSQRSSVVNVPQRFGDGGRIDAHGARFFV